MKKTALCGFTLLELLVVIGIMAVVGIFTLANYRSFGEDQKLKSAVLDLQSQLRKTQTNATANTKCKNSNPAKLWSMNFRKVLIATPQLLEIRCTDSSNVSAVQNIYTIPSGISIARICGDDLTCSAAASCFQTIAPYKIVGITLTPLTGTMTFQASTLCFQSAKTLTILLRHNNTGNRKALVVEQGGRVYAQ